MPLDLHEIQTDVIQSLSELTFPVEDLPAVTLYVDEYSGEFDDEEGWNTNLPCAFSDMLGLNDRIQAPDGTVLVESPSFFVIVANTITSYPHPLSILSAVISHLEGQEFTYDDRVYKALCVNQSKYAQDKAVKAYIAEFRLLP